MKKGKDMGFTACKRIQALAQEIGADLNYRRGWVAQASREMGLPYSTTYQIAIMKKKLSHRASTKTITAVCRQIGLSPNELMEG